MSSLPVKPVSIPSQPALNEISEAAAKRANTAAPTDASTSTEALILNVASAQPRGAQVADPAKALDKLVHDLITDSDSSEALKAHAKLDPARVHSILQDD